MKFSKKDIARLERHGVPSKKAGEQIKRFKKGFSFVRLIAPCTKKNGIWKLSPAEEHSAEKEFKRNAADKKIIKFVPASGAASRMFHFLEDDTPAAIREKNQFFESLRRFAFYSELSDALKKQGKDIEFLLRIRNWEPVLKALFDDAGLGYLRAPKGMILFHGAGKTSQTAFEEQLDEARIFLDRKKIVRVHFTLPASSRKRALTHLKRTAKKVRGVHWEIKDSIQSPATDCLAVEKNGMPVRDESGALLLRPAGHGALLKNLDLIRADLIYVKNIDNILPKKNRREADRWKKILCGIFFKKQQSLFFAQKILSQKTMRPKEAVCVLKLAQLWGWQGGGRQSLNQFFNRPMRVCGMVPNTGEPGGGPFWIEEKNGQTTRQIVEKAEVNLKDNKQAKIWNSSTHFNPVDFVCGVSDWRGKKHRLAEFVDTERGLISNKTHKGREIRVMELPGLWNGGMADWISFFVEIPKGVFAPVKTALDLLRPEHQVFLKATPKRKKI